MKKSKSLIILFYDWLKSRNIIWILPNRNEPPKNAIKTSIELLMMSMIIIPLLFARLLVAFYNLLPIKGRMSFEQKTHSFFEWDQKQIGFRSFFSNLISRPIVRAFLLCLSLSVLLYFSMPQLHIKAKQANLSVIDQIYNENDNIDIDSLLPVKEHFLASVLYNVYEARKRDHTSKDVIITRNQLNIDENLINNLNFTNKDIFLTYLYSLESTNKDNYLSDIKSISKIEGFLDKITQSIVDDYENGFFYTAKIKTDYYFKLYINQDFFPVSDIDNTMHSLRLLLSHRADLSTHRDFAQIAYNCLAKREYIESYKIRKACKNNDFLNNIALYCEGVLSFRRKGYVNAMNCFETCFEQSNDDLLKQYSALMCIRTAFWNFDRKRNKDNLLAYYHAYDKYSSAISLPYFLPDLSRYQVVVKEIENNPKFKF